MEQNKKGPIGKNQGNRSPVESENKTGSLREGKAKGTPSNVKKSEEEPEENRQINPNESRIMGNPRKENSRGSDEDDRGNSRRGDSSL